MSKEQRMSYIMYILLSGWDIYTLSLFSEELKCGQVGYSDDINLFLRNLVSTIFELTELQVTACLLPVMNFQSGVQ